jgi:uncharacterized repeat protein (TIGR01451 family)
MQFRVKPVLAGVTTALILAGYLTALAPVAQAATPPFEPDPNARGAVVFYDAIGHVVTHGSIDDSPVSAYVQTTGPGRSVDNTATMFGYLAQPGVNPGAWHGEQMSAGNTYPVSTAPAPLSSSPNPTVAGQAGEETLRTLETDFPHPSTDAGTAYDGVYQIRIFTSGASGQDPLYFRADIQINNTTGTWTQIYPPPAAPAQNPTTTLTVTPTSPQAPGTTVNLSAAVMPSIATGTVQFKDGATNLGPGVSVTAGTATTSTNTLTAGSHNLSAVFTPTDPTLYNPSTSNTVPYTISAPASTDLSITKTGPVTATVSSPLTYSIVATNNGPSPATGVVVTDTLPAGVTFVSASTGCTNAAGTVTCTIGSLANGASSTVTINATAPANAGNITNTATVTGNETDPNTANNKASASTTVSAPASSDLAITKTGAATAMVSSPITYTIKATNNGPSPATGVVVTDTLPTGVSFNSATASQGTCVNAAGTVTCTIGSLANGASSTVTINVTAPGTAGTITNTATVTGNETDPNPANNTASATTQVSAVAVASTDLAITKTAPATATVSSPLAYTLKVTNNGPSPATGVSVTDTLPAGVTFVSASTGCTNAAGTVTCTIGSLANGASVTLTINVTIPGTAGTITNTATVTGNETDPNPANNTASATTQVSAVAVASTDLAITKTGPATATVSSPITYVIVATNNGPGDATGVVVTDTLPTGVSFNSATASQGSCVSAAGTVTCTIGPLANGASSTIFINVTTPPSASTVTNSASVAGNETDPNPANNKASATTQVGQSAGPSADLAITKEAFPDPGQNPAPRFKVGTPFQYLITLQNLGPSSATNVKVTDVLPSGVTFNSVTATTGTTCANGSGTVTCTEPALSNHFGALITIHVTPTKPGMLSNTATVAANEPDPNPANNTATFTTIMVGRGKPVDVDADSFFGRAGTELSDVAVASFADDDDQAAGDYEVTIDWGDRTASTGVVTKTGDEGTYDVTGTHTYKHAGRFTVTVTVQDSDGDSGSDQATGHIRHHRCWWWWFD